MIAAPHGTGGEKRRKLMKLLRICNNNVIGSGAGEAWAELTRNEKETII